MSQIQRYKKLHIHKYTLILEFTDLFRSLGIVYRLILVRLQQFIDYVQVVSSRLPTCSGRGEQFTDFFGREQFFDLFRSREKAQTKEHCYNGYLKNPQNSLVTGRKIMEHKLYHIVKNSSLISS